MKNFVALLSFKGVMLKDPVFLHFDGAIQLKTRAARFEKHRPKVLDRKGTHDR